MSLISTGRVSGSRSIFNEAFNLLLTLSLGQRGGGVVHVSAQRGTVRGTQHLAVDLLCGLCMFLLCLVSSHFLKTSRLTGDSSLPVGDCLHVIVDLDQLLIRKK